MELRDLLRIIHEVETDLAPVLARVGKRRGVTLTIGQAQYSYSGTISFKISGTIAGALSPEERRYLDHRHDFLVDLPALHETYVYDGATWTILGMTAQRRIRVRRDDGLTIQLLPAVLNKRVRGESQARDDETEVSNG